MAEKKPTARLPRKPAHAFSITTGVAALVLSLLVVALFHQVSIGGKTFQSPDASAPVGFVRMGEQALWKDHVYPLWNPFVFLGMPSFASGAYNPLIYPPDWPLALVAKVIPLPDLTWMLIYYALGALFMFLLAREWGARPEAALIAGAAFVFAPNLVAVGSHGHGSQLVDSAYLPLLLWLASRWMRRGQVQDLGWLALAGGFQMLRGHVQICFYTWIAVALYVAFEWFASLRRGTLPTVSVRAVAAGLAAGLAFGLAGFYTLPLRDYAQHSIRGAGEGGGTGVAYATQWSLSPAELPSVVVPGWAGFGNQLYWGGMPFTDYPNAYIGMIAVLLAIPALLMRPRDAMTGLVRAFALTLAALALMISFGHYFPMYGLLYDHLPLFNKFRIPVMAILLFQLGMALLLAFGWSAVLERASAGEKAQKRAAEPLDRLLLALMALLAAALVIGVLGAGAWEGAYGRLASGMKPGYPLDAARLAYQGYVSDLGRACVLGLLALGAAWYTRRGTLTPLLGSLAVLALLLIELWPVSGRVMAPVIGDVTVRSLDAGRDDVVEFLEQAGPPGSFRVLPLADFRSNRYAGFGISSVGGYHAAKPRLIQDFLDADLSNSIAWWRVLNVRFIVTGEPLTDLPPFLREVHRGSGVVYENLLAMPRVTVLGAYRVIQPARAILDSIRAGAVDSEHETLLDRDPGLTLGPVQGASAEIRSYRLNDVTIDVKTPGPALVRLADAWYPDWTATVDGAPAPVLRADYLLRAVAVPAGTHTLVFRFTSPAVRRGLMLSVACALIAIALIAWGVWRGRRAAPAPAEAV